MKGRARPGKQGGADPSAAAAPLHQLTWIATELPRRTGRRSRKRLRLMASMSAIAQAPRRPRCGLCIELKIKHGGLLATATAAELQPRCRSTDSFESFDGLAVALPTAPAFRLQPRSSRESAPVEEGRRRGGSATLECAAISPPGPPPKRRTTTLTKVGFRLPLALRGFLYVRCLSLFCL